VQRAPGISHALCFLGAPFMHNSGDQRRGIAESHLPSLRGALATKQSSFLFCEATMDCFASLAMTV
jgi:hypothetical protein